MTKSMRSIGWSDVRRIELSFDRYCELSFFILADRKMETEGTQKFDHEKAREIIFPILTLPFQITLMSSVL